ncbi:hypothetical protein bpmyx0001_32490 [Bacillus pseudomycoides DSM 12442]|nr:hypothetical protein bpmyx0001_32490 [Bacillus pseudomycoides DSM 12442]
MPVVLESPCYICIVRSGGKHFSQGYLYNSKRLHIDGII